MGSQLALIRNAFGFDIVPCDGGFRLVDICPANNWGTRPYVFADADLAEDHAWRIERFKTGRTMTIPDPILARSAEG